MMTFVDPRVRMRDALRQLVQQERPAHDAASLALFRNRLLDETGSDARPLAELLLEAIRRGWLDALPNEPIAAARWDALTSPFVMRWSAERFVQPEMARWAAESWGFALGTIPEELLRIAPPKSVDIVAPTSREPAPTRAFANSSSSGPKASAAAGASASGAAYMRTPSLARSGKSRSVTRPTGSTLPTRSGAPTRPSVPHLNPKLVRNFAIFSASTYLLFIGQMAVSISKGRAADRAAARTTESLVATSQSSAGALSSGRASADSTRASGAANPLTPSVTSPLAIAPKTIDTTSLTVVQSQRVDAPVAPAADTRAPETALASGNAGLPGVPSITRNALPGSGVDAARMLIVEPARRASGASLPQTATGLAPTRTDPIAYDEVQLTDGTRMVGRVDIIRAGAVIFRDMRSGLRHEIRKDDIEQIITEFGTTVRFRTAEPTPMVAAGKAMAKGAAKGAITSMRERGVAGRYTIRYDAAKANGSPECTSVWTRTPQTVDHATVLHTPNADTLNIAFDGGDNFPSNIDHEGFFASTPRIMPDQARTSTALVTRLNGRFPSDGSLSLTVSIVFFRRMRAGPDLACTVTVNATGTREKQ